MSIEIINDNLSIEETEDYTIYHTGDGKISVPKFKISDFLPTDEEVAKWYEENIDESTATVSSSIYKFRLWLKDRVKQ